MTLREAIAYFTDEKHIMACLSVTCGTAGAEEHAMRGFTRLENVNPVEESSLYDLASLTKLFTGLCVMRLHEEGRLDLTRPVTAYAPQFQRLDAVTVDAVLGFEVLLLTEERIDVQPSRDAGLRQLYGIRPQPHGTGRFYSDMHAMVLKYVIEGASGERYEDYLHREILAPLGMHSTFAHVPASRLGDCVCYDKEHRIEGEKWFIREGILPGMPHDPKARLLSPHGEDLCGHAGLFSTREDMTRLCQSILQGNVVSRDSLLQMSRNRLGRALPEGGHTQYLGSQCFVKHPDQHFSEIPVYMSNYAIGLSGFTGHHVSVDMETGLFALFLGNRVLNRLSVLIPEKGKRLTDYGLHADGSGLLDWQDGTQVWSSVDYVHQKDARLHAPIQALLGVQPWHPQGSEWP